MFALWANICSRNTERSEVLPKQISEAYLRPLASYEVTRLLAKSEAFRLTGTKAKLLCLIAKCEAFRVRQEQAKLGLGASKQHQFGVAFQCFLTNLTQLSKAQHNPTTLWVVMPQLRTPQPFGLWTQQPLRLAQPQANCNLRLQARFRVKFSGFSSLFLPKWPQK